MIAFIKKNRYFVIGAILILVIAGFLGFKIYQERIAASLDAADGYDYAGIDVANLPPLPENIDELASRTEDEWRDALSATEFRILRERGTEVPFTSPLDKEDRAGTYVSADCGEPLFRSEQKFDSGTGWPSFWAPISKDAIALQEDGSFGVTRTEVIAPICKSHIGHVFEDAPQTPTGLRYCLNGVALRFVPDEQ